MSISIREFCEQFRVYFLTRDNVIATAPAAYMLAVEDGDAKLEILASFVSSEGRMAFLRRVMQFVARCEEKVPSTRREEVDVFWAGVEYARQKREEAEARRREIAAQDA